MWEVVAPLPVGQPAVKVVQSLPPSSQPAGPPVSVSVMPSVPHTPAQAEYCHNGRKRKSDFSHSVSQTQSYKMRPDHIKR